MFYKSGIHSFGEIKWAGKGKDFFGFVLWALFCLFVCLYLSKELTFWGFSILHCGTQKIKVNWEMADVKPH